MKTSRLSGLLSMALLALAAAPGEGKADELAARSGLLHGRFAPSPGAVRRSAELRARRRLPARSAAVPETLGKDTLAVDAELAAYDDGVMLVAVPVSAEQEAALLRQGAARVASRAQVRDETIFEGRYHRAYRCAPSLDEVAALRRVGQRVRLALSLSAGGRYVVVNLSSLP
jgi:hypothetical protein